MTYSAILFLAGTFFGPWVLAHAINYGVMFFCLLSDKIKYKKGKGIRVFDFTTDNGNKPSYFFPKCKVAAELLTDLAPEIQAERIHFGGWRVSSENFEKTLSAIRNNGQEYDQEILCPIPPVCRY